MSKKVWRSVMVAVLVVGFAVGPVGAAVAAPERGEVRYGAAWMVDAWEFVEGLWSRLIGERGEAMRNGEVEPPGPASDEIDHVTAAETSTTASGGNMDPNG